MWPWSPKITSRSAPPLMVSAPLPPKMRSRPASPRIVSSAPFPGSRGTQILDEIGRQQLVAGRKAELNVTGVAGGIAEHRLAPARCAPVAVDASAGYVLLSYAMVAEYYVVAGAALDGVGAGHEAVANRTERQVAGAGVGRHDQQRARDRVDVEARVAVDQVQAAVAVDLVVTRAASQVVTCARATDRVVAGTAIDGHAERRAVGVGRGEQRAGVDDVVASTLEGVGAREAEEVVRRPDLVEQLGAEHQVVDAAGQVRHAAVPQAVLRRVAVDDQRRVRAAAARDGDRVAGDRAAARSDRQVAATMHAGERAVARRPAPLWCRWLSLVAVSVPVMVSRSLPWPISRFSTSMEDLPVAASPKLMPPGRPARRSDSRRRRGGRHAESR